LNKCNHHRTMTRKLWRALRTTTLLAGAGFCSVLMVNLPSASAAHAHSQGGTSQSLVPASDRWINLGTETREKRQPVPASAIDALDEAQPTRSRQPRAIRLASLGHDLPRQERLGRSLSGGKVRWSASSRCLNAALRSVIAEVGANFSPVIVNSTCRSRAHNVGVGGAPRSRHLTGDAVDFKVGSNARAVLAFLAGHRAIGGLKHYADGHFHVDTGPRRTW
jgi:peptidase M15-like protein